MKTKNIGIEVKKPEKECSDEKCPFHGKLSIHGNIITGKVVSSRGQRTVVVQRDYQQFLTKYERYERRHSRISAYNPECISTKEGEIVKIAECRPLSKTKAFVVVEVVK